MAQTAAVILSIHNTISPLIFQCYDQRPDCFRRAWALCVFSDSICIPDNKVTGRITRQNADGSTAEHQCCHEPWVWWMITKFDWLFQADTLSNCLCVLFLSQVGCVSDHKLPKCQRQSPSGGCTKSNRPQRIHQIPLPLSTHFHFFSAPSTVTHPSRHLFSQLGVKLTFFSHTPSSRG